MLFFLVFSGLCTIPFTLTAAECQDGWTQFGSRCFRVFTAEANWTTSEQNCVTLGGHLASVHSSEEYTFIQDLVLNATGSNSYTWLGGTDSAQEGVWVWTDGSAFNYSTWASGQPDNYLNVENCLIMNWGVGWNDGACYVQYPSVCAKTFYTITTPSSAEPSTAVPLTTVPLTTVPLTAFPSTAVPSLVANRTSAPTSPENVLVMRLKVISMKDLMASNSSQLFLQQLKETLIDRGLQSNFTLRLRSISKKSP